MTKTRLQILGFMRSSKLKQQFPSENENNFSSLSVSFDFVLPVLDDFFCHDVTQFTKKYKRNSFNLFSILLHEDIMWKYFARLMMIPSIDINKYSFFANFSVLSWSQEFRWKTFDFFLISFALPRHGIPSLAPRYASESIKTLNDASKILFLCSINRQMISALGYHKATSQNDIY